MCSFFKSQPASHLTSSFSSKSTTNAFVSFSNLVLPASCAERQNVNEAVRAGTAMHAGCMRVTVRRE